MNIVTFASRKGGTGKSTLAAHLAAAAAQPRRRVLMIDADPQGSLTLWYTLREAANPELWTCTRNIRGALAEAAEEGFDWVFIDTPPTRSALVEQAIEAATLVVIPARPGLFDLAAVKDTIASAQDFDRPYAVVFNGAPAQRNSADAAAIADARAHLQSLKVPVWGGQITHRAAYSLSLPTGENACEYAPSSAAADEVARLWASINKSVRAINTAQKGGMHRLAA